MSAAGNRFMGKGVYIQHTQHERRGYIYNMYVSYNSTVLICCKGSIDKFIDKLHVDRAILYISHPLNQLNNKYLVCGSLRRRRIERRGKGLRQSPAVRYTSARGCVGKEEEG